MNPSLQNLFSLTPTQTQSVSNPLTGSPLFGQKSSGASVGDLMFGQLLTAQLQGSKTSSLGSTSLGTGQLSTAASQLQSAITQMLKNGMSIEQIAQQLGGSLSSNILAQLQLQGVDASSLRTSLSKMIAQALGPPSNGPPDQTAAQMASSLVQRFTQVANALTTTVSAYATGQQHDSLGTSSDANAGGSSAPNQTAGIVQSALVALQQFASNGSSNAASAANAASSQSGTQALAPPPAPWVPPSPQATSGGTTNGLATQTSQFQQAASAVAPPQSTGGPTVAANPSLAMLGSGADTVIGRILARAANVAADQANANAANASTPETTPGSTATLQPQIAVASAASAGGASSDTLMASLMQTLQNAINAVPQLKNASSTSADGVTATTGVGGTQASTLIANASFGGLPIVTTASITPTTAAPQTQTTAQEPPVDPNAVVDQVLQGINMRTLADGSQTVRMQLVPQSLGNVSVNLQVQGTSVNATLVAQNSDVRDALLANQQMLSRSLADAGLKLSGFTVNLANQGFQQQQQAYQPRFGTTRRFVGVTTSSDDDSIAAVPSYGPSSSQIAARQWLNALA